MERQLIKLEERIILLEDMEDFVPELKHICYEKSGMEGSWIFIPSSYYGNYKKFCIKNGYYKKSIIKFLVAGIKILQIVNNIHVTHKELSAFVDKVERESSAFSKRFCTECNKFHETIAFCNKCGACLYENSTQIPDDMYPLFKCTKCEQVNFWD